MTNTELTKIREDRKLSKKEFAIFLGITPMLLGKYEKGTSAIPESIAEKLKEAEDKATATEIEVKKTVRKGGRKAKEKIEETVAEMKEAVEDKTVATEIEVKKTARKSARKAKEAADIAAEELKKAAGMPNIIIQSPMGGIITPSDIANKVPKDTAEVYVRVDENKLYYVLKSGESGDIDIW